MGSAWQKLRKILSATKGNSIRLLLEKEKAPVPRFADLKRIFPDVFLPLRNSVSGSLLQNLDPILHPLHQLLYFNLQSPQSFVFLG